MRRTLRVAAYAVVVRNGQILLARSPDGAGGHEWVLPGGGMEHGEDPYDTVRRELMEETGYRIDVTGLLGIDSSRRTFTHRRRRQEDHQGLRLVYEGLITGGELRPETNGSTDLAAWHDLGAMSGLTKVGLVDVGLELWLERPVTGRVAKTGTQG
ncbi:NUDIX domain-containing protein [Streptomyces sp. ADMS]|uniref:NUDIX hydrolase n=1 Tax=Streptomyces sp. ADMS TaxID=3071415 RepID=UPI00296F2304|nr:NUDIX domain-containing protein [Streptomyces sp. ADMS]MDW4905833.1 NUDIX domain-containing protein [Streptomyces sp. ADMS]